MLAGIPRRWLPRADVAFAICERPPKTRNPAVPGRGGRGRDVINSFKAIRFVTAAVVPLPGALPARSEGDSHARGRRSAFRECCFGIGFVRGDFVMSARLR